MWSKFVLMAFVVVFLSSCGTKRKISSNVSTNVVVLADGFSINNLDFRTFNGRAKSKIEIGDEKKDFTLHIRMEKDKAIWMSITATVVNYEAARLLITPDSVKIMNKMHSEYIAKPFSYIHRYTGDGIDFNILQDMLLANVNRKLLLTEQLTVASAGEETQLVGVSNGLSFQYSLNENKRPRVFRLSEKKANETLEAFYGSFAEVTGYNFPQNQNVNLNTSYLTIKALIDYNKVEFNEPVEMPFVVPEKYKLIN